VAGGVGANCALRQRLIALAQEEGGAAYFPRAEFCTDNGAMIAFVGCLRLQSGAPARGGFDVRARWPLDTLAAIADG
jgi:N6-L-threonylcarbamoyladenine synthase